MRTERMALFPELVCDRGESEGPIGRLGCDEHAEPDRLPVVHLFED